MKDYLIIQIEKDKLDSFKNDDENEIVDDGKPPNNLLNPTNTDYKDYLSRFDSFLNESKEKLKNLESK